MVSQGIDRFGENIRRFMKLESAGGLTLLAARIAAMMIKNSPLSSAYQSLLLLEGEVRVGVLSVEKSASLACRQNRHGCRCMASRCCAGSVSS